MCRDGAVLTVEEDVTWKNETSYQRAGKDSKQFEIEPVSWLSDYGRLRPNLAIKPRSRADGFWLSALLGDPALTSQHRGPQEPSSGSLIGCQPDSLSGNSSHPDSISPIPTGSPESNLARQP
jgi:hypothetical protein